MSTVSTKTSPERQEPCLYTVAEAAAILRRQPKTVRTYIKDGTLQAHWHRGRYLIPDASIDAFLTATEVGPPPIPTAEPFRLPRRPQ